MIIYKVTNKIDGKGYIGQTTSSMKKRWNQHRSRHSHCSYLHRAIDKYGKDNFEIRILSRCESMEEMNHREAYYIKLFNTLSPNGYNLSTGGDNYKRSKESIEGVAAKNRGKKRSEEFKKNCALRRTGKKASEETKKKMSLKRKGSGSFWFGKKLTGEAIAKMSKTKKELAKITPSPLLGRKLSEETKLKISQSHEIPIVCNETGVRYDSAKKASIELKISHCNINSVCNKKRKTARGFTFSFVDKKEK